MTKELNELLDQDIKQTAKIVYNELIKSGTPEEEALQLVKDYYDEEFNPKEVYRG